MEVEPSPGGTATSQARVARTLLSSSFHENERPKPPSPCPMMLVILRHAPFTGRRTDATCRQQRRCAPSPTLSTAERRQPPFAHVREATRICLAHVETAAREPAPSAAEGSKERSDAPVGLTRNQTSVIPTEAERKRAKWRDLLFPLSRSTPSSNSSPEGAAHDSPGRKPGGKRRGDGTESRRDGRQ